MRDVLFLCLQLKSAFGSIIKHCLDAISSMFPTWSSAHSWSYMEKFWLFYQVINRLKRVNEFYLIIF